VLLKLRNDLALVRGTKGGGRQKGGEVGVFLEDSRERLEGFGGRFESGGFRSGRVLQKIVSIALSGSIEGSALPRHRKNCSWGSRNRTRALA
jgi:hypothetical protein